MTHLSRAGESPAHEVGGVLDGVRPPAREELLHRAVVRGVEDQEAEVAPRLVGLNSGLNVRLVKLESPLRGEKPREGEE